ncbi:OmpA family protein [uncultured Phenylobacterium sp.]|uniref:OmpA family protein n=1 Tax=uncultured Phenylobacterium sp. TaxID=349273 RepID=UPI0025CEEC5F|nr:OmpA family protein [uncultured Phenylobacterium sp.]
MTSVEHLRRAVVAAALAAGAACGPVPPPVQPAARDLIVLAPHPEGDALGAAAVTAGPQTVDLTQVNEGVRSVAGQPLPPPAVLPAAEVTRLFGDALAVIPPPARRFLLYFALGSNDLTPESRALLPEILALVKERGQPDVSVVGHTDTTGAAAANVDLGLRRATLVRDLLVGSGLGADLVEVASHGETNPVEPTPDNTENARNRRVEVTVR